MTILERLFGAFNLAAEAMGTTTQGMNDMLQRGEVLASDLLPKLSPLIKEVANNNGALEKQLDSTRVAQQRFNLTVQESADTIFKAGFGEGLKELFAELSDQLNDSGKAQKDLGNIYNKFFKALKNVIKVTTPVVEAFIHSMSKVVDILSVAGSGIKSLIDTVDRMGSPLNGATIAVLGLAAAMKAVYAKTLIAIAGFQEIASLFDDKLVGVLEKDLGKQINLKTMETREIVVTEEGTFDAADFTRNVILDVDETVKDFDTLKAFLSNNKLSFDQLADKMNMTSGELLKNISKSEGISPEIKSSLKELAIRSNVSSGTLDKLDGGLSKFLTNLDGSSEKLDEFTNAIGKASTAQFNLTDVLDSPTGLTASAIAAASALWAIGGILSAFKGLGKIFGKGKDLLKRTPKTTMKGKKESKTTSLKERASKLKNRVLSSPAVKTLPKAVPRAALDPLSLASMATGSTNSTPDVLKFNLDRARKELLENPEDVGLKSRIEAMEQRLNYMQPPTLNVPMSPMMTQQAMSTQAPSQSIIFEGMDINVNIPDASPEAAQEAGTLLAESFSESLASKLEGLTQRGRR